MSISDMVIIANTYNVDLNWLLTGTGSIYKEPAHARDPKYRLISLPVVADIAAGVGIEAEDIEPREHISIPALLLPQPGPYYCFRVSGISMEPELHTGDYAVVAGFRFDEDYNGAICAFRSIDGLLIKRLVVDHRGKRSLLIPINPSQPIMIYDDTSPEITLIGRLITVIRKY
jgi:SOS-response transcriptional repressor LexA